MFGIAHRKRKKPRNLGAGFFIVMKLQVISEIVEPVASHERMFVSYLSAFL